MRKRQKDMFQSNQANEGTETAMQPQGGLAPAENFLADQQALPQTAEASAEAIKTIETSEQQGTPTEHTTKGVEANEAAAKTGLGETPDPTAAEAQSKADVEADLQAEIEEVDAALADLLSSADFVSGNAANTVRQANAILAVVNHAKGKRVKIHKSVLQKLDVQEGDFLSITVKGKQVILLASLNGEGIPLKRGGYLYNSELVVDITQEFAFDFSDQSTHHLLSVSYKRWNNQVIAIIIE